VRGEGNAAVAPSLGPRGWFWWTSSLLAYVTRPSVLLARDVERRAEAAGLTAALASGVKVIGLHVRHGDSCLPKEKRRMARTCSPVKEYLEHLRSLAAQLGTTAVFVATDDQAR